MSDNFSDVLARIRKKKVLPLVRERAVLLSVRETTWKKWSRAVPSS